MIKLSRIAIFLLLSAFFVTSTLTSTAQTPLQAVVTHVVKKGETLYRLSVDYGVTVDAIMAANPGLTAHNLTEGRSVRIPAKSGMVQQTSRDNANYAAEDTIIVTTTLEKYKVKKDDTMWNVAQRHNITLDELMAANPEMREADYKMKKGKTIQIPVKTEKRVALPPRGLNSVRVAVVLPFKGNGVEHHRSVEFYRGFLMALESYKEKGKNITVDVVDEPRPGADFATVKNRLCALQPDLIVGPLYPVHFSEIAKFANAKTKVAVPFSSKVKEVTNQRGLYVLNTPEAYEQRLACDLVLDAFPRTTKVVFVNTSVGNKSALATSLRLRLVEKDYKVGEVSATASAAQLYAAAVGAKSVLYVPNDDSETVMADLLQKTKEVAKMNGGIQTATLGYAAWLGRAAKHKENFYASNAYILTPQFFYPGTRAAMDFVAQYTKWFHAQLLDVVPAMAPLGYDCAHCFIGGLTTYGHKFSTQKVGADFLQSDLRFEAAAPDAGYVNRSMWLVHYRTDRSIVKISAK